jgi:glycosyltransferase involved in cell wall biosynthesis
MAMGLPPIGSRSGAAGEIIEDGVSGFLVDPDAPDEIAKILESLGADRARLSRMSEAARKRFAQFPTWEQTGAAIVAFLERLHC